MTRILGWLAGIAIAGVVVATVASTFRQGSTTSASALSAQGSRVSVLVTSDPVGAQVDLSGRVQGVTPLTLTLDSGRSYNYRVVADEPYADYSLYKPYSGTIQPVEDTAISVWLERTTAEEQAGQRKAAEDRRREAQEAACRSRLASISLIIEDWHWSRSHGYAIAEGRVTNRTNSTLRNILAVVEYETSSGQFITSDNSLLDYQDLLPGQTTPFKVYTSLNPAMSRAYLTFREMFGGPVQAARRSDLECQ